MFKIIIMILFGVGDSEPPDQVEVKPSPENKAQKARDRNCRVRMLFDMIQVAENSSHFNEWTSLD